MIDGASTWITELELKTLFGCVKTYRGPQKQQVMSWTQVNQSIKQLTYLGKTQLFKYIRHRSRDKCMIDGPGRRLFIYEYTISRHLATKCNYYPQISLYLEV